MTWAHKIPSSFLWLGMKTWGTINAHAIFLIKISYKYIGSFIALVLANIPKHSIKELKSYQVDTRISHQKGCFECNWLCNYYSVCSCFSSHTCTTIDKKSFKRNFDYRVRISSPKSFHKLDLKFHLYLAFDCILCWDCQYSLFIARIARLRLIKALHITIYEIESPNSPQKNANKPEEFKLELRSGVCL